MCPESYPYVGLVGPTPLMLFNIVLCLLHCLQVGSYIVGFDSIQFQYGKNTV